MSSVHWQAGCILVSTIRFEVLKEVDRGELRSVLLGYHQEKKRRPIQQM